MVVDGMEVTLLWTGLVSDFVGLSHFGCGFGTLGPFLSSWPLCFGGLLIVTDSRGTWDASATHARPR